MMKNVWFENFGEKKAKYVCGLTKTEYSQKKS